MINKGIFCVAFLSIFISSALILSNCESKSQKQIINELSELEKSLETSIKDLNKATEIMNNIKEYSFWSPILEVLRQDISNTKVDVDSAKKKLESKLVNESKKMAKLAIVKSEKILHLIQRIKTIEPYRPEIIFGPPNAKGIGPVFIVENDKGKDVVVKEGDEIEKFYIIKSGMKPIDGQYFKIHVGKLHVHRQNNELVMNLWDRYGQNIGTLYHSGVLKLDSAYNETIQMALRENKK